MFQGGTLKRGCFAGQTAPTCEIVAAGWGIKAGKWLTTFYPVDDHGLACTEGIFPAVPRSPVFPSGLIGLSQKGDHLFDVMTATTLLYGSQQMGWDPAPVVMARLGLSRELAANLQEFPVKWQISCNGWGHIMDVKEDNELRFKTRKVTDVASPHGEKIPLPMWPFRHMSMESMSILATAMNESLLQSYDGILRIVPAFPVDRAGRFTLHAEGGFIVSAEIEAGKVRWICIKSLFGNDCKLELPWDKAVTGRIKTSHRWAIQNQPL